MEPMYFLFLFIWINNFLFNKVEGSRAESIVGGELARTNKFGFAVAVMYKPREAGLPDQNPCSGTIIDEWFITTVAHCFYDKEAESYRNKEFYITISVLDILFPMLTTRYIRVDLVIIPTSYDPYSLDTYSTKGDLAVVKLKSGVGLYENNPAVKKLTLSKDLIQDSNGHYYVAGFGWNQIKLIKQEYNYLVEFKQSGRGGGRLRFAKVELLDYEDCRNAFQDNIAIGNMCASIVQAPDEHKGICQGDSGGPLFSGNYLSGIAINGLIECNENKKPGIYLKISVYYEFINNVVHRNQTSDMRILQLQQHSATTFEFQEIATLV